MSSNLDRIPPLTSELVALERLKKKSYKLVSTLAPSFLIGSSSCLQITRTSIISLTSSNFSQILPRTAELAVLERLKNPHRHNGENLVSTLVPSFLIGSSTFLQVMRTTIKASIRPDLALECNFLFSSARSCNHHQKGSFEY